MGAFCDLCLLFHLGAVFLAVHAGVLFFAVVGARFCWLCARDVVLGGCIAVSLFAVCYTSHHIERMPCAGGRIRATMQGHAGPRGRST